MIDIGVCFHREQDPAGVATQAAAAESAGYDEFWVIEDCFYTSGPTLASAALTATESLRVGIGIMPTVARNPAITAMELATLARLAPGRFHAGVGHGVQSWMAQMGAKVASPLTVLSETLTVVRRLLAGERLTMNGRYVSLDEVALQPAPEVAPPVSAGVRGEKSLRIAGRESDGTIFADFVSPTYLRWSATHINAGLGQRDGSPQHGPEPADGAHRYTVFASMVVGPDGDEMRRVAAPFLAEVCAQAPTSLRMAPFFDELAERAEATSWLEAVSSMPSQWWRQIAAVGTPDDAAAYVTGLVEAGADAVAFFPDPTDPITDQGRSLALLRSALG